MKKYLFTLALFLNCGIAILSTNAQFTMTGQFRPRTEFRNGFKKPIMDGQDPALFTEQRTRLNLMYKSDKFDTKLSVQDVRIWGEVGQINKTDGLFSVHEAYADYNMSATSKLRIGRQELVYDDHRVLGSLGWAAQARSHDAVRFITKDTAGISEFHAVLTWNQDNTPAEPAKLQATNATSFPAVAGAYANTQANTIFQLSNPKSTQFVWYKRKFGKSNVSALVLNDVNQTTDSTSHTRSLIGVNPTIMAGPLKIFGSFYYQFGQQNDSVDYQGMMASLQLTYTKAKKVIPTLGFDFLSGDDKTTSDVVEGFNPLYGTHHKFYGLMDYFYVGNGHNGGGNQASGGLLDVYAKAVIKTSGKAKFLTHLHFFSSPTDVTSTVDGSTAGSFLGTELDIVYVQPLTAGVTLKAGYSQMFTTDETYFIKGVNPADEGGMNSWAWVMINFAPKFL